MKNADMPAMPSEQIIETVNGMGHGTKKVSFAGLTKREMIAMHAMQGYLNGMLAWSDGLEGGSAATYPEDTAELAVKYADALLEELAK